MIRHGRTMTDEAVVRIHSPIKTVWGWPPNSPAPVLMDGVTPADVRRLILKQPEHIQDCGFLASSR